jgi:hypothetical protein
VAHLDRTGLVVAEVYPEDMDWAPLIGASNAHGPVTITVTRAIVDGSTVDANVRYELDGRSWDQPFVARMQTTAELTTLLASAGLRIDQWLDRPGWFVAVRT